MMSRFIDRVVVHLQAGHGGNGCASIHREKFKPLGGPDGGNGGHGGSIIFVVDPSTHTLLDFHFHPHLRAPSGKHGEGNHRHGKSGSDMIVKVPNGTMIYDQHNHLLADLVGPQARYIGARGGRGGLGNAALVSRTRKAPGFALLGEHGQQLQLTLELKTVADVGLIGFPSAGKSSLISAISAAKPKIADYPFTTLVPHLGVVHQDEYTFTVADVPGLIPGASQGKGLGLEFLRHIERCSILVHVLDCATMDPTRDPLTDLACLEEELAAYHHHIPHDSPLGDLGDRPRVVVLNKIDIPQAHQRATDVAPLIRQRYGWPVFAISVATHQGLAELITFLGHYLLTHPHHDEAEHARPIIRVLDSAPTSDIHISADGQGGYRISGTRIERWVQQTNFDNEEAVGYLGDRLAKAGIEEQLIKIGATPGCHVHIGEMSFDWDPTIPAGIDITPISRGNDPRFERSHRPSAAQRKRARQLRRTHQGD